MKSSAFVFIIIFAASVIAFAQGGNNQPALTSLVEAERNFSKASVAKGIREAFIMNLADDATLFRPHAVAGKKWMTEQPARQGLLTWRPVYADVSRSGDLGYTTGPWEFRKNGPDDKEAVHGNFVTVWKKQADATWKVVIDLGISNPPPAGKSEEIQFGETARARSKGVKTDVAFERAAILSAEREFSRASEEKGATNAYLAYATDDVRVFREDKFPFIGKQALGEALAELKGALAWQPAKADASSAGDLGYTYGIAEFKPKGASKTEYFNYMRVWKKQSNGSWKMALDVFNSCPPPPANGARR
jgi:ketosteroid isomerase-like protein